MSRQDGGPAFGSFKKLGEAVLSEGGITVRDYFAAQALSGVLQNQMVLTGLQKMSPDDSTSPLVAKMAYQIADAMMAERIK